MGESVAGRGRGEEEDCVQALPSCSGPLSSSHAGRAPQLLASREAGYFHVKNKESRSAIDVLGDLEQVAAFLRTFLSL